MADNKTRAIQLLRTDDSIEGKVRFYDRRQTDVNKAFVAEVDVSKLDRKALLRLAVHGATQNILDSSNKLEGDERVTFVRKACATVQQGGWSSAPVDEAKLQENVVNGLMKMGFTREAALAAIAAKKA
jgi:hypothetical protein